MPINIPIFIRQENTSSSEGLRRFIDTGVELMKQSQFEQAIRYFRDGDQAQKLGLTMDPHFIPVYEKDSFTKADVTALCELASTSSVYDSTNKTLKVYDIHLPKNLKKPPELSHNSALTHLEIWLNALQGISGKPLTGLHNVHLDVAKYMLDHKIPLTNEFLNRHKRQELFRLPEPPPKPFEPIPGAFAMVRRSTGEVKLMHIIAKTPDKRPIKPGLIGVRDASGFKEVTRQSLVEQNPNELQPFKGKSRREIEDIIKQVGGIQGEEDFYDTSDILKRIEAIFEKEANVNVVPRSAGLRDRVVELKPLKR